MQQPDPMKIVIDAVHLAQSKGVYTLQQSKIIAQAIEAIILPKQQEPKDVVEKEDGDK